MHPRVSGKLPSQLKRGGVVRPIVVPIAGLLRVFLLGAAGIVASIYALYRYYFVAPLHTTVTAAPASTEVPVDLEPASSK